MADAPIVGVLVGGGLTLAGQGAAEFYKARREARASRAFARSAARLQRDDFSGALEAVHYTLWHREWWPNGLDLPLGSQLEDRRTLASYLGGREFRRVSGSLRRFAQLRSKRESRMGVFRDDDYYDALVTYCDLAAGRLALVKLAEYPEDPWPMPIEVDPELEQRARESVGIPSEADLYVRGPWPDHMKH